MTATPAVEPPIALPQPGPTVTADRRYVWLLIFATFGVFMAFVTPLGISLAIRVDQLAAGRAEYLGYITGAGGVGALLATPVAGMLSDRTRSRFGRRRPWLLAATGLGIVSLLVMALAPTVLVLGLGWVLAQMGWGSVLALLLTSQADRLSEAQRGRVAGLSGVVQQLAPVAGVLLAGGLSGNNLLLFLVPGAAGIVAMALFVGLVPEPSTRDAELPQPLTRAALFRSYVFDPRRSPDFAWNWFGRSLFITGLTFNTTFTAFFFADRLDVAVEEVTGELASVAGIGILAAILGAFGGGYLSDRLRRRRAFILIGACVFAAAVITMALSPSVPLILAASVVSNLGLGIFSAVDQALVLDVLPDKETDAGRFTGINGFSTSIPQGVAPFIAPAFLAIGASGDEKNYTLLYLIAAAFTVVGGLVVLTRVKSVR